MNSTGLHSAPILHADVKSGNRNNSQYTCTTSCTGFMFAGATSSLRFGKEPVPPTTDASFGNTEDPMDIHQPPPHVVDYWFDQLGLSLDPTSSENPSNATSPPFQFPPFDGIDYVSLLLSILCHTIIFRPVHPLKGFSDWFPIAHPWNCEC